MFPQNHIQISMNPKRMATYIANILNVYSPISLTGQLATQSFFEVQQILYCY